MPTTSQTTTSWTLPFTPTARQQAAINSPADELLYGGASGGGKTALLIAQAINLCLLVPGARVLILRRTFSALERTIEPEIRSRLPRIVGTYNQSKHQFAFRNGSLLDLGYLESEDDKYQYQGTAYQMILMDELTQFTETQYNYLRSRLRAAGDVAERLAQLGWRPRVMSASNPGGRSHAWVRARFVDPAPAGQVFRPAATTPGRTPGTRVYIPARVSDNPYLDASYADRLADLGDPVLVRALLDGDWDILEGVRFPQWRQAVHVIDPEQLPIGVGAGYVQAVGVDYGSRAPFVALWGALLPDGLVVVYREVAGTNLTAVQQAAMMAAAEAPGERGPGRSIPIALDPSCWARGHTTPGTWATTDPSLPPPGSIAHDYRKMFGSAVVKAINDRRSGWSLLDEKLRVQADGLPRLLVYSTCRQLIKYLPAAPRDLRDPGDVDTNSHDHEIDSLRYLLMELEGKRQMVDSPPADQWIGWGLPDPLTAQTGHLATAGF